MYRTLFVYFYTFSVIIGMVTSIELIVLQTTIQNIVKTEEKPLITDTDVIQLNVGGELITTTRSTLTRITNSTLAIMFNGYWEDKLNRDKQGNIFFDFNPIIFQHLLEQLRFIKNEESYIFYPPASSLLVIPFEKMLRKLGIDQSQQQQLKDVLELNVGGEILTTRQNILNQISNLTTNLFIDSDPKVLRRLVNQLREKQKINIEPVTTETTELFTTTFPSTTAETTELFTTTFPSTTAETTELLNTTFPSTTVTITTTETITTTVITTTTETDYNDGICANASWNPNGVTVAGGNGKGSELNQLDHPMGLYIDDNSTIYIADTYNHRIMKWLAGAVNGEMLVSYNESKNFVSSVVVNKNGTIYFCDRFNNRIIQWYNDNEEIILSNISCWGLALDKQGSLYISGHEDHRIIKWPGQEIVAGGHGEGDDDDQLSSPYQIFVDHNQTIYIADYFNHRIIKWFNNLQEGLVVAGGNGYGHELDQLKLPHSVIVDHMGTMYIVDFGNDRILRWFKHSKTGIVIIGNDESTNNKTKQLSDPYDIAFDRQGNLYVADTSSHRIQMFKIDKGACLTTSNSDEQ